MKDILTIIFSFPDFDSTIKKTIHWYTNGMPYVLINKRLHDCQHGKDRDKKRKEKRKENKVIAISHD